MGSTGSQNLRKRPLNCSLKVLYFLQWNCRVLLLMLNIALLISVGGSCLALFEALLVGTPKMLLLIDGKGLDLAAEGYDEDSLAQWYIALRAADRIRQDLAAAQCKSEKN